MPYCPNCGGHVAVHEDCCSECGADPGGGVATGDRDGGGETADRGRRPGGQPGAMGGRGESTDERTRRTAITYAAGCLGLTVLGAAGLEFVSEEGPKDAVGAWRAAWEAGDATTYREYWHPEAPAREGEHRRGAADERLQYTVQDRELLDRDGATATVRDAFVLEHPGFETRRRFVDVVDLQTVSGSWLIRAVRTESVEEATDCSRGFSATGTTSLTCE